MQVSIDTAVLRCKVMKVHILDLETELNRRPCHQDASVCRFPQMGSRSSDVAAELLL